MIEQLPGGGIELSPDQIDDLHARWSCSWTPNEVAQQLAGIRMPWYVAAGWALDLFLGRQTRLHGDIEIAVPDASFPEVRRRFPGYVFDAAGSGRTWEDATPEVLAAVHQTWLRDPATGNYLLDVFREPHDRGTRNVVERCFHRLKQWRGIATRYDKRPDRYLAAITLANTLSWLDT